jgi:hypothetical protein
MAQPEQFMNLLNNTRTALINAVNSIFGASGPNHSAGLVPDPGSSAGTTRFLAEDSTWKVPATSTTVNSPFEVDNTVASGGTTGNAQINLNTRGFGLSSAANSVTPYNVLFDTAGNFSVFLGGGGSSPDHANYYRNTVHRLQDINGANTQITLQNGATGLQLNQYGAGVLSTNASGVVSAVSIHALIAIIPYGSSQTITIPAGASAAFVRLQGGGGGALSGVGGTSSAVAAAGNGGYLEKLLTGLTAGNTLSLTLGAGGTAGPTAGGASTLASGSQSITTLTANGGGAGNGGAGTGGTSTNGDYNEQGASGLASSPSIGCTVISYGPSNGSTPFGQPNGTGAGRANTGMGALAFNGSSAAGGSGVCQIWWFT